MNLTEVYRNERDKIANYISRGVKISQSTHHRNMFILSFPDGGFCNITSSAEAILRTHPADKSEFKENGKFNFTHTGRYKAVNQKIPKYRPLVWR